MENTLQFHSGLFKLIEGVTKCAITDDSKTSSATEMRATKKFDSVEESKHHGNTAVLGPGPYGTCSQGEFDASCGSILS